MGRAEECYGDAQDLGARVGQDRWTDQQDDSGKPNHATSQTSAGEGFLGEEDRRQQDHQDWHGAEQYAAHATLDMLLAPGDCTEGDRRRQKAEPEERDPSLAVEWQVRAEGAHQTPADGRRDQRPERGGGERRDFLDGDI